MALRTVSPFQSTRESSPTAVAPAIDHRIYFGARVRDEREACRKLSARDPDCRGTKDFSSETTDLVKATTFQDGEGERGPLRRIGAFGVPRVGAQPPPPLSIFAAQTLIAAPTAPKSGPLTSPPDAMTGPSVAKRWYGMRLPSSS